MIQMQLIPRMPNARVRIICGPEKLVQCSYSVEVLQQAGKVLAAGHKDVKVVGGWMAPRRVVGVWAWSSLLSCCCCCCCCCWWNPTSQRSGLPTAGASSSCYTLLLQMRIITSLLEIV